MNTYYDLLEAFRKKHGIPDDATTESLRISPAQAAQGYELAWLPRTSVYDSPSVILEREVLRFEQWSTKGGRHWFLAYSKKRNIIFVVVGEGTINV